MFGVREGDLGDGDRLNNSMSATWIEHGLDGDVPFLAGFGTAADLTLGESAASRGMTCGP